MSDSSERLEAITQITKALNCIPFSCPAASKVLREELARLIRESAAQRVAKEGAK